MFKFCFVVSYRSEDNPRERIINILFKGCLHPFKVKLTRKKLHCLIYSIYTLSFLIFVISRFDKFLRETFYIKRKYGTRRLQLLCSMNDRHISLISFITEDRYLTTRNGTRERIFYAPSSLERPPTPAFQFTTRRVSPRVQLHTNVRI